MASPVETMRALRAMLDDITYLPQLQVQAVAEWDRIPTCWYKDEVLISQVLDSDSSHANYFHEKLADRITDSNFLAALLYEMSRSQSTFDKISEIILRPRFNRYGNPFGEAALPLIEQIDQKQRVSWREVKTTLGVSDYKPFPQDDDDLLLLRSLYCPRRADTCSIVADILEQTHLWKSFPWLAATLFQAISRDEGVSKLLVPYLPDLVPGALYFLGGIQLYRGVLIGTTAEVIRLIRPYVASAPMELREAAVIDGKMAVLCLLPELAHGFSISVSLGEALNRFQLAWESETGMRKILEELSGQYSFGEMYHSLSLEQVGTFNIRIWGNYSDLAEMDRFKGHPDVLRQVYREKIRSGKAPAHFAARYFKEVEAVVPDEIRGDLLAWLKHSPKDWRCGHSTGKDVAFRIAELVVKYQIRIERRLDRTNVLALTSAGYQFSDAELSRPITPFVDEQNYADLVSWSFWRRPVTEVERLLRLNREPDLLVTSYLWNRSSCSVETQQLFDKVCCERIDFQKVLVHLAFSCAKKRWVSESLTELRNFSRTYLEVEPKRLTWVANYKTEIDDYLGHIAAIQLFDGHRLLLDQLYTPHEQLSLLLEDGLAECDAAMIPLAFELAGAESEAFMKRVVNMVVGEIKHRDAVSKVIRLFDWALAILRRDPTNRELVDLMRTHVTNVEKKIASIAYTAYWSLKRTGKLPEPKPTVATV